MDIGMSSEFLAIILSGFVIVISSRTSNAHLQSFLFDFFWDRE